MCCPTNVVAYLLCLLQLQVIAFIREAVLVAGGFDGEMYMFSCKQQHWQLLRNIQGKRLPCTIACDLNKSSLNHNACLPVNTAPGHDTLWTKPIIRSSARSGLDLEQNSLQSNSGLCRCLLVVIASQISTYCTLSHKVALLDFHRGPSAIT